MDRRIIVSCLVILLVICLVASIAAIAGAGLLIFERSSSAESPIEDVQLPAQELANTPAVPSEVTPSAGPPTESTPIDPQVARQMDLIQIQVIQERGLEPQGDFIRVLFSPDQLRQRVLDDFLSDYTPEEAGQDVIVLSAFGLLEPGFDFHTLYTELLSEQIAGFYDDETKEMVVVQGDAFGGTERLTYAHEYTHALQDQNFDIDEGLNFNEEACEDDTERCAAIQALLEGDATLTELNWFTQNATAQDQQEIFAFYESYESPIFDSAPEFLTQDFIFPYDQGYVFVEYLHARGGWGSVNRAYSTPPVSTEQILHPEKYPGELPLIVELPDLLPVLGAGWEELDNNVMGEWYTFLILAYGNETAARLEESLAAEAAAGWGGDRYAVYYNAASDSTLMVLHTVWDAPAEAVEFEQAFREYAQKRFGSPVSTQPGDLAWQTPDGYHRLHNDGQATTWILAVDAAQAEAVWNALQP